MSSELHTPTAATPTAAPRKGRDKKGSEADGARKRGEIGGAGGRKDEPPRKLVQRTLEAMETTTPAFTAAAGVVEVESSNEEHGTEQRQEGRQELDWADTEPRDDSSSHSSRGTDGGTPSAASFSSRPGSRASSTSCRGCRRPGNRTGSPRRPGYDYGPGGEWDA